ncbi:hypothetical protein C6499_05905 [Candidatus Poribacteria bacterium]|nr:MAG: hypothetical protein C6499_05905 [Candidatus Poribacteria bacterium]
MNSRTTKRFRQMLAKLPSNIQQQAKGAYKPFRENSHHPSLQFKKTYDTEPIYFVGININYRTIGVVENEEIVWFWIGPHAEYENLLGEL